MAMDLAKFGNASNTLTGENAIAFIEYMKNPPEYTERTKACIREIRKELQNSNK